jgi:phosphate transport system permease protein
MSERLYGDRVWSGTLFAAAAFVFVVLGGVVVVCLVMARPLGTVESVWSFLSGDVWDPVHNVFGARPFIWGTLLTSTLGVLLATPVAIGLALFVTEMATPRLRRLVTFVVDILAAIPSVVYGLWGLLVLVPFLRNWLEPLLQKIFGVRGLFSGEPLGLGYLAAGILLGIMVLPTIATVAIEVLRAVPPTLREGALALGATRWEAVRIAVLPYARRGLVGAVVLGMARAVGETMAVTMVIGNQVSLSRSLLAPGYSLPSVLANEFVSADGVHRAALAALALVLVGVTIAMSAVARVLVRLTTRPGAVAEAVR